MGQTVLKRGVKLDNLIQIAHNVVVGEHTVMAAQVGVSGSTQIGARSMFGGQAGVAGHLKLPEDFKVGAQAGIGGTYPDNVKAVMGTPGFEVKAFYKSSALFRRLPEMDKRITALEKKAEGKE
jgi:UDP-3-O-[3-hydroxymyristoyl] glucosamine N-acyltransferase